MVVVTHEMGFAREVSNHVMFLHKGVVEDQGNPREVLANPSSERLRQFLSGNLKWVNWPGDPDRQPHTAALSSLPQLLDARIASTTQAVVVVAHRVFLVIVLVVVLGQIELGSGLNFGVDLFEPPRLQQLIPAGLGR